MRVDGIGDALACVPLLASLQSARHSVGALLTTRNAGIFAPQAFDHVHVVERIPWPKHGYTTSTWESALHGALEARYDIALVASEEPEAYTFARRTRIAQRIGFHNGLQKPLKSWWARRQLTRAIYRPATQPAQPRHEVDVLYDLGRGLHSDGEPTHDPRVLRRLIVEREVGNSRIPAVQITSKWLSSSRDEDVVRTWFAQLLQAAPWEGFCSQAERALGERLGAAAGLRMRYFASVEEWKEAVAAAPYLITPDTGAAHVAGMLCVPCTDIFEAADYEVQTARWAPWCGPHVLRAFPADRAEAPGFAMKLIGDWRRA